MCVLGVSYIVENKIIFMEFIIFGEGGGDKRINYIYKLYVMLDIFEDK